MKKIFIAVLVCSVVAMACHKSNSVAAYDACASSVGKETTISQEIAQMKTKWWDQGMSSATAYTCPGLGLKTGLHYQIISEGTGARPTASSNVLVKYTGYLDSLNDRHVFDSSPSAALPLDIVVEGWRQGLPLIKENGRILLYLTPSIAYGAKDVTDTRGNVIIPANSPLVFDITLQAVQ